MTDIKRYGASDVSGSYYYVKEFGMAAESYVTTYFIDDLGKTTKIGSRYAGDGWTQEEVDELPTLAEATTEHLAPAFEEAETNRKAWVERRKSQEPTPPDPPPLSPEAQRFLEDED